MRRLSLALVSAVSALALTQIASAADLPRKAPAYMPPPPPPFTWTGCYIGINGGGAWKKTEFDISNNNAAFFGPAFAAGSTPNHYDIDNMSGGIVGGTLGCNYQTGAVVFGIEGDWDWADVSGSTSIATAVAPFVNGFGTASEKLKSIGTLRGRLGTTIIDPRLLAYVTGGFAWGDVESNYSWAYPATNELYVGSASETRTGWTVGGGLEYAFLGNFSGKLEGLYYELDGTDFVASKQTAVGPAGAAHLVSTGKDKGWMLRAGLNYKFW